MEQRLNISVVVPLYNEEESLRELVAWIDRVATASKLSYEVIMIDDGSSDRSGVICDEYAAKDERIRVIHQENGGVSRARNRGVAEARGEYILFLDSDDVYHPSFVELMIKGTKNLMN